MRNDSNNHHITIDAISNFPCTLPFEMQPIVHSNSSMVYGYELLFRGINPQRWIDVDRQLLLHLCKVKSEVKLFINVSNDGFMEIEEEFFIQAATLNDIVFELSESHTDNQTFIQISRKINELALRGLKFALDDFGSGHDGFHRLYSLNNVSVIKIDGSLLRSALTRPDAKNTLKSLIQHWTNDGILSVGECIESKDIYECASELEINLMQGWYVDQLVQKNTPIINMNAAPCAFNYMALKVG